MLTCSIDLSGFRKAVHRSIETIQIGVRDAARNAAEEGAAYAKEVGAFKDQTGNLRRGITADPVSSTPRSAVWMILSAMPYSVFVESGTKAHDIWPKAGHGLKGPVRNGQTRRASGRGPHEQIVGRGRALRWVNGGQTFFAAHVHHPGSHPYPFIGPAIHKAEAVLYRELESIASRLDRIWGHV